MTPRGYTCCLRLVVDGGGTAAASKWRKRAFRESSMERLFVNVESFVLIRYMNIDMNIDMNIG